jgi:hypothetical protein
MNRALRTGKGRSFWRIASLTFLWPLTVAGLVFALAPTSARAAAGGVPAEIAALQAQVAELQSIVHTLQDQVSALQASNTALQRELAAVQSNKALLLGPFVNVDPNPENGVIGPNITFKGANLHIVSGLGATDDNGHRSGLGNLILGYDELNFLEVPDRGGSHNLVIGRFHKFTSAAWGGLVVGERNTIQNSEASVSGGAGNIARGFASNVSGGQLNTASDFFASVSGGLSNKASGFCASVSGGNDNTASGISSVSGGQSNTASGAFASISGGISNTASGRGTVVIGGVNVIDNKDNSIAPQPPFP